MSVRKEVNNVFSVGRNGEQILEDVTIFVTTKEEALAIKILGFSIASTLTIIETGGVYMLDENGDRGGKWRSVVDGSLLS